MKKLLIILISLFTLTACNSIQGSKIEKVEVPIFSCPRPDIPNKPDLEIDKITRTSTDSEVLKAYGETIDQLELYSESLLRELEGYNSIAR